MDKKNEYLSTESYALGFSYYIAGKYGIWVMGNSSLVDFSYYGWIVGKAPCHHAAENKIELFRPRPFFFKIVYFKTDSRNISLSLSVSFAYLDYVGRQHTNN